MTTIAPQETDPPDNRPDGATQATLPANPHLLARAARIANFSHSPISSHLWLSHLFLLATRGAAILMARIIGTLSERH